MSETPASYEHDRRQAARTAEWLASPSRTLLDLHAVRQFVTRLELDASDLGMPIKAQGWLAAVRRVTVATDEGRQARTEEVAG